MNEREKTLYKILAAISDTDAPLIFKGALITRLILEENGYRSADRPTNDIDANWIGNPPTMDVLVSVINKSLESLGNTLHAEARRAYSDTTSAGIKIINRKTGEQFVTMDIEVKPIIGSKIYYHGEMSIRGALATAVLSDKICAFIR
jgi:hypothetical protein